MKLTSTVYEGFALNVSLRVATHESQMKARAPAAALPARHAPQKEHAIGLAPGDVARSSGAPRSSSIDLSRSGIDPVSSSSSLCSRERKYARSATNAAL